MRAETAEQLKVVGASQRDWQMARDLHKIAQNMELLRVTLEMFFYKMYDEECCEALNDLRKTPNAEVRLIPSE